MCYSADMAETSMPIPDCFADIKDDSVVSIVVARTSETEFYRVFRVKDGHLWDYGILTKPRATSAA